MGLIQGGLIKGEMPFTSLAAPRSSVKCAVFVFGAACCSLLRQCKTLNLLTGGILNTLTKNGNPHTLLNDLRGPVLKYLSPGGEVIDSLDLTVLDTLWTPGGTLL